MIHTQEIIRNMRVPIPVMAFDSVDSTNDQARAYLSAHSAERMVLLANSQTAGRGRLGRSFYSPPDTGIYMTYVLRVGAFERRALLATTAACVAVMKALDCGAKIKWVNDLYLNGKKICGILTEAITQKGQSYLLIGIGINLSTSDFPETLCGIAGAISKYLDREATIARICDELSYMADRFPSSEHLFDYRRNLLGLGQTIRYTEAGQTHDAMILGIDEMGGLLVMDGGERRTLYSGEITMHGHGQLWE